MAYKSFNTIQTPDNQNTNRLFRYFTEICLPVHDALWFIISNMSPYKPLFDGVQEVLEGSEGCAFTPDSQAAHVDHVLWLRGTLGKRWQKDIYLKSSVGLHYVCVRACVCVSLPVALAYTTLAFGSLFCRSSTALPIFVDVAFLALWHSSKIICDGERSRAHSEDVECQAENCVCEDFKNERIQLRQSLACTNLRSV